MDIKTLNARKVKLENSRKKKVKRFLNILSGKALPENCPTMMTNIVVKEDKEDRRY